jgi:hypothetical protein
MAIYYNKGGSPATTQPGGWSGTVAPKGRWINYWPVVSTTIAAPGVGLIWGNAKGEIPNLGLQSEIDSAALLASNRNPLWAGVDCVGFAKNTVLYLGSAYVWALNETKRNYPTRIGAANTITQWSDMDPKTLQWPLLRYLVPGDVFYYTDDKGNPIHIGIVMSNDGTSVPRGIGLIESTHTTQFNISNVSTGRTLADIQDRKWVVGDLK